MEKTVDTIIGWIEKTISAGDIIPPEKWIDAAFNLNALIGRENEKYADLYHRAHKIQYEAVESGETASKAEMRMKASPEYRDMLAQKAKCEQVIEFIRIAKIRSGNAREEYNLN